VTVHTIRDTVEWFKTHGLISTTTCAYPIAGESWMALTFTGHCETVSKPKVDLTCRNVAGPRQQDTDKSSDSFPLLFVLVIAINGFLLYFAEDWHYTAGEELLEIQPQILTVGLTKISTMMTSGQVMTIITKLYIHCPDICPS